MQPQVKKLDFTGQKFFVGLDTHKNSWKVSIVHEELLLKKLIINTGGPEREWSKFNYCEPRRYTNNQ